MTRLPLDVQVSTFQQVLSEELPLTTARRAFRTAIRVAMGEEKVFREPRPRPAKKGRQTVKLGVSAPLKSDENRTRNNG